MSTKKIKKVENERSAIIDRLVSTEMALPGAFKEVLRKCGKANCWCKKEGGHPYMRITWSENGVSKTKAIPKNDAEWIVRVTSNYRTFRQLRCDLKKLENQSRKLIDVFEKKMVNETKKLKGYLS